MLTRFTVEGKEKANTVVDSVKSQTQQRYDTIKNNYFGYKKVGADNVYNILSLAESFETTAETPYSEQKGIGKKATIVQGGEELRKYSLPIKLHYSYCIPDDIIIRLEEKQRLGEVFSFFFKNSYIGEFVINKVTSNVIDMIDDTTVYAEITVDLIEYYDDKNEDEYKQQTIQQVDLDNVAEDIEVKTPSFAAKVKSEATDIFQMLTDKVVKEAMRTSEGYINSSIGGLY